MGKFLDWLKADSAMGEVMRSRSEEASALNGDLERCKSKLSTLKRNCPNFTPKEDEK